MPVEAPAGTGRAGLSRRAHHPYAWLPALIVIVTVAVLVVGGLALHYIERQLVVMTGESLSLAAAEVADKLDRLLFERYGDVLMMARAFSLHIHNKRYLADYLDRMERAYPVYLWLGVTDAEGRVVVSTDQVAVGQDHRNSPWFQAVRRADRVHVGDVEPYAVTGGIDAVAFTAPVIGPKGEFLGAVTSRVGLPALEATVTRTIRTFQEREGFFGTFEYQFLTYEGVAFIDSDLFHKGNVNLKRLGLPSALLSETVSSGFVEEEHLRRHVPVVTGFASTRSEGDFEGLHWTVLLRVDRSDVLAPIQRVTWNLGLAGALVVLPLLLLLGWSVRRLRGEWEQARHESERVRAAEATLRESEERTRLIVETALDAVIVMDADGRITDWNSRAEATFGWSRQEVIGRPLSTTVIPPQYREAHERGLRRFLATGEGPVLNKRIEVTACYRDGHEFPVELTISPAQHEGRYTFSAFVRDITERKQVENRQAAQLAISLVLAESKTLAEAAPRLLQAVCETVRWEVGEIWRVDRAGNVLRWENVWHLPAIPVEEFVSASKKITFSPGIGLPGRVWVSGAPAWIPDIAQDSNFPRASSAATLGLHGAFAFPVKSGKVVVGVLEFFSHEIKPPDVDLLRMMADIGIKIGQFMEREQLEIQLRQAQKMEAIGQLAAGIAHDFNNLLTVITGYSQLLLRRGGLDAFLGPRIEEIQKAGERAGELTNQLLAFSRQQVLEPKVFNLNDVMAGVEGMLKRLIGEHIELVTIPAQGLWLVKADPGQIGQVLVNLAVNARDAMPQGGRLTIKTANAKLEGTTADRPAFVPPGFYVMLAVSDTGVGMDDATRARVFEPFFTTKPKGAGTGLGLSTVYGIVKQSGGFIDVSSEPGQGTTFRIYLPQVLERAEAAVLPQVAAIPSRGSETILLAEDESTIRALVSEVLRAQGYRVLEAHDAAEAIRISQEWRARNTPIDLLLTDVVMPGGSGRELAERLGAVMPDTKVLYMSGYTDDAIIQHGLSQAEVAFLRKPFTPDALARKIRELLGKVETGRT
jgi:PAS domain S-box-containing protein